jgi:hypothetical protein
MTKKNKSGEVCSIIVCEDPETGEILFSPSGDCPKGTFRRYMAKVVEKGITLKD